jgi:hypothetical protein
MFKNFWQWYEARYKVIVPMTAVLFLLQILHLYWLTVDVALPKLVGRSLWELSPFWDALIVLVDYTEIPAIISSSVFYIHQYKTNIEKKSESIFFLIFINSQWLHLLWITDEIVVGQFTGSATVLLPLWLVWLAIAIDYLEVPVMYDTTKKAIRALRKPR